ncbi:hypothetical protein OEA41_010762 [Lepraria neglecta]|uniref:Uncharacterized protein n=1 Tax=Lepraria neglecta TaxID=209136 RepID=A0AAE0DFU9_9LECA|nr:hypothetical protein OEA41_010762 [Lepraria neglecta]
MKVSDENWVQEWMTRLLSEDKGSYVLRITLYVLRNFNDEQISYGRKEQYGDHERIKKLYRRPYLEKIVKSEIDAKRGRLVITSECISNL